jgi:hypothetical protein
VLTEDYLTVREVAARLKVSPSTVRLWCQGDGEGGSEPVLESVRIVACKSGEARASPDDRRAEYRVMASSLATHLLSTYSGDSLRRIDLIAEALASLAKDDRVACVTLAQEKVRSRRAAAQQLNLTPQPRAAMTPDLPGMGSPAKAATPPPTATPTSTPPTP